MANWAGVEFSVVYHRDGRMFREPGLFAFARSDSRDGALLLFVGQAESLAQEAGPGHPLWADALRLGMDALHICFPMPRRIDRLQLLSRIIQREQPLLNVVDEVPGALTASARLRRAQL